MKQVFSVSKLSNLLNVLDEKGYLEYRDQQDGKESLSHFVQEQFNTKKALNDNLTIEEVERSALARNSDWTLKEAYQLYELDILEYDSDAWHETFVVKKDRRENINAMKIKVKELVESNQETLSVELRCHFS